MILLFVNLIFIVLRRLKNSLKIFQLKFKKIGIRQLMATVAADNTASQAMLVKAGYTLRGSLLNWLRHGELYKNALIYQLSTRQATE